MKTLASIEVIDHKAQRYPTVGDWIEFPNGELVVRVSDTGNWKYDLLVGIHELVEAALCRARGVEQAEVDAFDMSFEKHRTPEDGEPGDDPRAPYQREHRFAENIERLVAHELGVNWQDYDNTIAGLSQCE